jgi:hypothetical protein
MWNTCNHGPEYLQGPARPYADVQPALCAPSVTTAAPAWQKPSVIDPVAAAPAPDYTQTLEERRLELIEKFALALATNPGAFECSPADVMVAAARMSDALIAVCRKEEK